MKLLSHCAGTSTKTRAVSFERASMFDQKVCTDSILTSSLLAVQQLSNFPRQLFFGDKTNVSANYSPAFQDRAENNTELFLHLVEKQNCPADAAPCMALSVTPLQWLLDIELAGNRTKIRTNVKGCCISSASGKNRSDSKCSRVGRRDHIRITADRYSRSSPR